MKTICVAGKNDIAVNILLHLLKFYSHEFKLVVTCNSNENGINSWQNYLRSSYQSAKLHHSWKKIESNIISKFEVLQSHTQLFPNISADISKTTILL